MGPNTERVTGDFDNNVCQRGMGVAGDDSREFKRELKNKKKNKRVLKTPLQVYCEENVLSVPPTTRKNPRLCGLETTEIYFSQFWKLEV